MSSTTNHTNHGAAAEPEDAPAPAPAYDPRRFQNPHPDDRAGKGKTKGKGKPAKSNKKTATTTTSDPKGKDSVALGICGWCEEEGAKMKCSQCKTEVYCDRECQRVSGRCAPSLPPPRTATPSVPWAGRTLALPPPVVARSISGLAELAHPCLGLLSF